MKNYRTTESAKIDIKTKWGKEIIIPSDYIFKNVDEKTDFVCSKHGNFKTSFYRLINGKYPCPKCSPTGPKGLDALIRKANKIHKFKYDYSFNDENYKQTGLVIICPEHGKFIQRTGDHLSGCGCPHCYKQTKTTDINDFLVEAIGKHGNKYNYKFIFDEYETKSSLLTIFCYKHGEFKQNGVDHARGSGCPRCNSSKGEDATKQWLIKNGIKFTPQKKYNNLLSKKGGKLSYDFYLDDLNILIEYDGTGHFSPRNGQEENFQLTLENDRLKNQYALENKIGLIRIKFDEDIDAKLKFLKDIG